MIIRSLHLAEGLYQKHIDFSPKVNLIHSGRNSVGKTTLLRLLLYAIGYPIPNTKNIRFEDCDVRTVVEVGDNTYTIQRFRDSLEVSDGETQTTYILPSELTDFHTLLFKTGNLDILQNLLGAFYVDQERGWTLLNRGTAIGKIRFSIENLIIGLSDRSCNDLRAELKIVEQELSKYRKMYSIAEYQQGITEMKETLIQENHDEKLEQKIAVLLSERRVLQDELKRISEVLRKNRSFKNYITQMKLRVKNPYGEPIPVNEDTIIDYRENTEYQKAKQRLVEASLANIDREIQELEVSRSRNDGRLQVETLLESFDQDIAKIKIDQVVVNKAINQLEAKRASLKNEISQVTRADNDIIPKLYNIIAGYAEELGLLEYIDPKQDYILTRDLKSLSGAILHKMVFVFRLAYIQAIQDKLGITLPIILDSPSGREVERVNVDDMMTVLARDFNDNQIIIASIFDYPILNEVYRIELGDRLIDEPTQYNG